MTGIKTIKIDDASLRYQTCLRKADANESEAGYNGFIDSNSEAKTALRCTLKGKSIEDLPEELRKPLRKEVDSTSSKKNAFNDIIDEEEVGSAIEVISHLKKPIDVLAYIVLGRYSDYYLEDYSIDKKKFHFVTDINIDSPWVASWKKVGLTAEPYKSGIKVSGTLLGDCDNFTWTINKKLPIGEKFLVFDVEYEAEKGEWGGACMFTLEANGRAVRPINVYSQPDGMIIRHSGQLIFPIDDIDEIRTLSIKTFDGKNIDLKIQNIKVYASTSKVKPEEIKTTCQVNQIGYLANFEKKAILAVSQKREGLKPINFEMYSKESGKKVFSSKSSPWKYFPGSGQTYCILDFSPLTKTGSFYIKIPKQEGIVEEITSYDFNIANAPLDLYKDVRDVSINAYYYWTCGKNGPYKCHSKDERAIEFQTGKKIDASGGWHDAGDYGKYVVPGAYTANMFLLALEYYKEAFDSDKILAILKQEIDWLLKMQKEDGSVHHKACSRDWPMDEVFPEADTYIKTVIPISTTATADFAGVLAKVSAFYNSKEYLEAAKRAWKFLENNPEMILIKPTYEGKEYGGPYIDEGKNGNDKDERLWAAVELYKATKAKKYKNYIEKNLEIKNIRNEDILDWSSVNFFAYYSYYNSDNKIKDELKKYLVSYADMLLLLQETNPYDIAIMGRKGLFDWGSNSVILTTAFQLLLTAKITGEEKYKTAALKMLNYIFGLNPLNKSFVTGFGDDSPKNIHYRPTMSKHISLPPGLLVGGVNSSNIGGDVPLASIWNSPPYLRYVDHHRSWATNEVAINWNSALAVVLSIITK